MLLGGFNGLMFFSNPMLFNKSDSLEIKNVILDSIKIDDELVSFLEEKEPWGYNTVLYGEFNNTLEAGNITNGGLQIDYLKIKKRKKDEMIWQDIKVFNFDIDKKRYNYEDILVESIEKYEYAVQPVTADILGKESISEVFTEFDGIWLIGDKVQHQIVYNTEINEIRANISQNVVTTLGNKYPFLISNGNINYKEFTVSGRLVSKASEKASVIDKYEEKMLRKNISSFLEDGKPKIVKDNSGNYVLCQVVETPTYTPLNELDRGIYDISFTVVEIGDAYDEDTLLQYNILKKEDTMYGGE